MKINDVSTVAFATRWCLGDLLCSMPLILHWKRNVFPYTSVTLVVSEKTAPLAFFLQGFDQLAVIPHTLKGMWDMRRQQRKPYFDLAISCFPKHSIEMDALLFSLKAKQRKCMIKHKWLNPFGFFCKEPVYYDPSSAESRHQALAALKILFPEFEEVPESLYPKIVLPKQQPLPDIEGLKDFFEQDDSPLILISTSNKREYCFLGVRSHVEILDSLHSEQRIRVVISSIHDDLIYAQAIANQLSAPSCIVCTPQLSDLLNILQKVDLVFVGEGGLMHMAAALDKFQVALFRTRKMVQWAPLSKRAVCLDHPEHVNKIPQHSILDALKMQLEHRNATTFRYN